MRRTISADAAADVTIVNARQARRIRRRIWRAAFATGKIEPPAEMAAAIFDRPERLIPLRDAIAARFVQLAGAKAGIYSKWQGLLDRSLVELPPAPFATMPDREVTELLDALASNGGSSYFGRLYLRMADAGPRTLSFYERQLSKEQHWTGSGLTSALAICRIGQASDEAKAILKSIFIKDSSSDTYDSNVTLSSRTFVTLLKLGDPDVIGADLTGLKRKDVIDWYDAVRRGKGKTDIGPNNCQGWGSPARRDLQWPSTLRPGLVYKDSTWVEATTK